jgi:hypothetical protein
MGTESYRRDWVVPNTRDVYSLMGTESYRRGWAVPNTRDGC